MEQEAIETVDGELLSVEKARWECQRNFYAGFAMLPFAWAANVWLFWPHLRSGRDPVITKYTQRSAIGFVAAMAVFVPWMLMYSIAGARILGKQAFDKLDTDAWTWIQAAMDDFGS